MITDTKVKLLAVGDMSLADSAINVGAGVRTKMELNGTEFPFGLVKSEIKDYDIVFGNLEAVISDYGYKKNNLISSEMRAFPESANVLSITGFNYLNIANNHILQHGEKAYYDTIKLLEQNSIEVIGDKDQSKKYKCKPKFFEKNGLRIGFLGYAFEKDMYYKNDPLYSQFDPFEIEEDIKKLKKEVNVIVLSCHWGLEFMDRPSSLTISMARHFIRAGADIILGHHPHVLQGIENYERGIIIYSLGNFIFDMSWNPRFLETMMVSIDISKDEINYKIIPIKINKHFQPYIINENEKKIFFKNLEILNQNVLNEFNGDREKNSIIYYQEYEKLRKQDRMNSYKHFIKHFNQYDNEIIKQNFKRTFLRRVEDIKNYIKH